VSALVLAAQTVPAAPVLSLMLAGIVIAVAGHIGRNYRVVGVGLAVLFVATALMFLVGFAAYQGDEPDPRPAKAPTSPGY
jgi:putative exporter of polyketide antibiotics